MVLNNDEYNCMYSTFDIEQHKTHYIDYLEVLIDWTGKISYAIPSHQEAMIREACERFGISRQILESLTPHSYYGDWMRWLSYMSGTIAVYADGYQGEILTTPQGLALSKLKSEGLYFGDCPDPYEYE